MLMKILQLIFLSALLLSQPAFATLNSSANCPSRDFISQTQFKTAVLCNDAYGIWCLLSEPFQHQNKEWNIRFAVILPSAITAKEALTQGTEYFKNQLNLSKPEITKQGDQVECVYAKSNQFRVGAYTPKVESFVEIE